MKTYLQRLTPLIMAGISLPVLPMTAATPTPYENAIKLTSQMSRNDQAQKLASEFSLQILDLTWEDTGRYKDSAVGPNISDMTIQVGLKKPSGDFEVSCMPVIRFPNFADKSADLDPRDFTLLVGNQNGGDLKRISLHDFLVDPLPYLSNADSWKKKLGKKRTLIADRDSKVLVSAQACFLPIPAQGKATFNPVLFNYQSYKENPAVLTILVTRQGTSVTVIDNQRDAFASGSSWGQRLFFNKNGERASLTGERQSEFEVKNPTEKNAGPGVGDESGLNMVLLIQVPLKFKERPRAPMMMFSEGAPQPAPTASVSRAESDVENAVIGHGEIEGPFTEIDNLSIERDSRFPVRVTVQFYKATSNGVVSKADLRSIKEQIDRVYSQSDYVGSLVTAGDTGRITEYEGSKVQPPGWWDDFWKRHEENTGDDREAAIAKLKKLLGDDYMTLPVCDLYVRDVLKKS